MKKIAIIGDGGWGTTLAILLQGKGYRAGLWGPFPEYIAELKKRRENVKFLPGVKIPEGIALSENIAEVLEEANLIIVAVPTRFVRSVLTKFKGREPKKAVILSVAKGLENGTNLRVSEIIRSVLGRKKIAVLSGPSIAYEVARGVPTTVVAAATDEPTSRRIQEIFMTERFRVYTNRDLAGVELGGALKNIIAIAAGISDGLGFGANTKAALLARGLAEIKRLGVKLGAKEETFNGLAGMGDMVTTCISPHGRNRWLGEQIGRGARLSEILASDERSFEGAWTVKSAFDLSKKHKLEMPITAEIYAVLYGDKDPKTAVKELMLRPPKSEHHSYA